MCKFHSLSIPNNAFTQIDVTKYILYVKCIQLFNVSTISVHFKPFSLLKFEAQEGENKMLCWSNVHYLLNYTSYKEFLEKLSIQFCGRYLP